MFKPCDKVTDYFERPSQVGILDSGVVGVGAVGAKEQGHWVKFKLVFIEKGALQGAQYWAYGCPYTLATSAYLIHSCVGKSSQVARDCDQDALISAFKVPALKRYAVIRASDAWIHALQDAAEQGSL